MFKVYRFFRLTGVVTTYPNLLLLLLRISATLSITHMMSGESFTPEVDFLLIT